MHEVPKFIVDTVLKYTLLIDSSVTKKSFNSKYSELQALVNDFLSNIDSGFVSNNSQSFQDFLESRVGKVHFTKNFAIRIRPDSIRLFVGGKEIFDDKKEIQTEKFRVL
jgi:hypothetical protein